MPGKATVQTAIIESLDGTACLTTSELVTATGESQKAVPKATCQLVSRGLIERVEIGCFQLTKEGLDAKANGMKLTSGPSGPRSKKYVKRPASRTARQKIWRVIRRQTKFTIADLILRTEAGRSNVETYIKILVASGYLAELPRKAAGNSPTSNGFKRFSLIRDTGYLAPIRQNKSKYRKSARVFDPNTKGFFPCG